MSSSQGTLNTIALFGATGMLGGTILEALLDGVIQGYQPTVRVFLRPGKDVKDAYKHHARVEIVRCDYPQGGDELVEKLRGVDALVSVLNGPGYKSHYTLLEAAIKAGQYFAVSLFDARHAHCMVRAAQVSNGSIPRSMASTICTAPRVTLVLVFCPYVTILTRRWTMTMTMTVAPPDSCGTRRSALICTSSCTPTFLLGRSRTPLLVWVTSGIRFGLAASSTFSLY